MQRIQISLAPQPEADHIFFLDREEKPPYLYYTNGDGSFNRVFGLDADGSVSLLYSGPRAANEIFGANEAGTLIRLNGYVILDHLDDGRYLCADREDGPILCRDAQGKVIFQLSVPWNWDVFTSVDPHFIYIQDFQRRQLHVYDRTKRQPPKMFPLPASLLPSINGHTPRLRFREDELIIGGLDERCNYVNYHYQQDQIVSVETVWTRPEGDFYFWRFRERGGQALLLYSASVERKGALKPAMVCCLIDLNTSGALAKRLFALGFPVSATPPVGELLWIDNTHFCYAYGGGRKSGSNISVYSTQEGRLFNMKAAGYVPSGGMATDGRNVYILEQQFRPRETAENSILILRDALSIN